MRALRIHGYGGPEAMRLDEVPMPSAAPAQVLVKVRAASVNPIDWKMRRGMLAAIFPVSFPRTLGRDCAGEANGALIAGVADPRTNGTHAEYALLPESATAPVPAGLEAAAAASLCIAGLSAWIPLVEVAKVERGMRVLIHGGAGGVGSLAVQIARELGAEVFTTSNFADAGPFDVVLDTLGGEAHVRSLAGLKPGGVLVALSATPVPPHAVPDGVRVEKPQVQATRERLARIFDWAASGRLRPQVTKRFAFEDAREAYAAAEAPHGRGKIVLEIS